MSEKPIDDIEQQYSEEELRQIIKENISLNFLTPSEAASDAISSFFQNMEIVDTKHGVDEIFGLDRAVLHKELIKQNEALFSGDMHRVEAMLLNQSHTLQAMFTSLIHKMSNAKLINQFETYGRLALKAQNQCRQTLATLGELKNPKRATFIKQQNNALNQQINNSKKNQENESNELLEVTPSERLDTGTPQAAIGADQELETMGAIDRTEDRHRQNEG